MALPILLLGGAALLMLAGSKKSDGGASGSAGGGTGSSGGTVTTRVGKKAPPSRAKVTPVICPTGSVKNDTGKCVPYWDDGSAAILAAHFVSIYNAKGKPKAACDLGVVQEDPFTENVVYKYNNTQLSIIKEGLSKAYPWIPSSTFPAEDGSELWVQHLWRRAYWTFMDSVCGYKPVT